MNRFSVAIAAFTLALISSGCQGTAYGSANGDAERMEEYDRQMAKSSEQQAIADRQIAAVEEQRKRMDVLLDRWEKQADRYDAILTRWEKQGGSGER